MPSGYAKVICELPSDVHHGWFRRIDQHWCELREGEQAPPGFDHFTKRHAGNALYFSPCSWKHPWTNELPFVAPVHALWVSVPISTDMLPSRSLSAHLSDLWRIDPQSEQAARARLLGPLPPSILLHEANRLSAFYLLQEPLDALDARR